MKTLKDFETEEYSWGSQIPSMELKAEAAKWVKDCSGSLKWRENDIRCDGCKWFINFFNLTAEDLK